MLHILKKPLHEYNEQHLSKIRLKVQTRLSQIKNQIDHFSFIESWIIQYSKQSDHILCSSSSNYFKTTAYL